MVFPLLVKIKRLIIGISILITIFIANLAIVYRYVLGSSLPWSEELLRFMFVWIVFIGASLAYKKDQLVDLSLVTDLAKGRLSLFFDLLRHLLSFLFIIIILYQSFMIMIAEINTGKISAAMEIQVWLVTAGLVLGSLLWSIFSIIKIFYAIKRFIITK